ncbi:hypothetical protein O0I10_001868 [Lichtheimia ornata]|uniref:GrpE protein homolog, mitochondrial n=1 Tax=Lichtheimia ornata TaxID=688661 RepID=A0AAD7VC42_9FUNG|nr:uncharacterized protein O0I10_001868 [Lichtheimia ornata]KAJ8662175.1 hypothetical protein O0I10_001868 [Lichtheimia ornata]
MHRSARRLVNLHSRHTPRRNVIPSFTRIAFARQYASQSEQPVANHQQLLQEKDQRITELQEAFQQCVKDNETLQGRSQQEIANTRDYAISKFAKDLLDTVDVLGMALASVPANMRKADTNTAPAEKSLDQLVNFYTGVSMTDAELSKTLKRHGLEAFKPTLGEKLDPKRATAAFQKVMPGKEPGTIFTVKKPGYTLHGKLLRQAQVGVVAEKRGMATAANATVNNPPKTTLLFSITDKVGALENCLSAIKAMDVSLTRIESRPSKTAGWDYDFFVDLDAVNTNQVNQVVERLRKHTADVRVIGAEVQNSVPWFPRKMADLDTFAEKVLEMGEELSSDHPGAHDPAYRERRADITRKAKAFRTGDPVPHVNYTPEEVDTWGIIYRKLTAMYRTHACREHQYVFPLLEQNCGYSDKNIPQLETVSKFLKDCTGFTIRPVMGLLTSRDFLNAFAFRVFHSTQYIRHHSRPLYTPEPDVCHELLGHAPLFADPDFADFCHEIGLASLGASDEDIKKLATIFWFTAEFGLCRQGDEIKAYGAGLLSSFGELDYSLSDKPDLRPFEPSKTAVQPYPITEFQPVYFVADSFKDAQEKVRDFASTMNRPFSVRYNALTQSVEVLDSKDKVVRFAKGIRDDMKTLTNVIESLA